MRFTYLYLENYIGIYNGMGLHKIEINLALCRHKMLIIRGENGSGKSTIFNALSVMPDSNDVFIPGMSATKIIRLQDGHTSYEMRFIHPVKSDGSRDTTKAYISRSMNNQMVELNPNGNVTSFKDILYDELGLDPNFIALSQLSLDDKGLAGKKPAERKRFVNAIMSSLEVYNNIYKALTKRSNSLKAVMNTVTTKLGALGDLTVLQANLDNLESQINIYYAEKDKAANELMKYRAQIELIDPDGSIQSKHTTLATKTAYDDKELRKLLSRFPFNIFDIDYSLMRKPDVKETIRGQQFISISIRFNRGNRMVNSLPPIFTVTRRWDLHSNEYKQSTDVLVKIESYSRKKNIRCSEKVTMTFLSNFLHKIKYIYIPAIKDENVFNNTLDLLQQSLYSSVYRKDLDAPVNATKIR